MSKRLFNIETINMLSKNNNVTYISESLLVLPLNLELKLRNVIQYMMLENYFKVLVSILQCLGSVDYSLYMVDI